MTSATPPDVCGDLERKNFPSRGPTARFRNLFSHQVVWHPDAKWRHALPRNFKITLGVHVDEGGTRRFWPMENRRTFAERVSVGGLVLMQSYLGLSQGDVANYHFSRLMFRWIQRFREFNHWTFSKTCALYKRSYHRRDERNHFLPDHLGTNQEKVANWTPMDLLSQGEQALGTNQRSTGDTSYVLSAGFWQAAKNLPYPDVDGSDDKQLDRVRTAYILADKSTIDPCVREEVLERLRKLVQKHLYDTQAEFEHWFFKTPCDVVDAIVKANRSGSSLKHDVVRQVLLDLGWDSFRAVGDCVHAQMSVIARMLGNTLTNHEWDLFRLDFLQNRFLGRLPLLVLPCPNSIFAKGLSELELNPTDSLTQRAFLTLFRYYGDIALSKREWDRRPKQRRVRPITKKNRFTAFQ